MSVWLSILLVLFMQKPNTENVRIFQRVNVCLLPSIGSRSLSMRISNCRRQKDATCRVHSFVTVHTDIKGQCLVVAALYITFLKQPGLEHKMAISEPSVSFRQYFRLAQSVQVWVLNGMYPILFLFHQCVCLLFLLSFFFFLCLCVGLFGACFFYADWLSPHGSAWNTDGNSGGLTELLSVWRNAHLWLLLKTVCTFRVCCNYANLLPCKQRKQCSGSTPFSFCVGNRSRRWSPWGWPSRLRRCLRWTPAAWPHQ